MVSDCDEYEIRIMADVLKAVWCIAKCCKHTYKLTIKQIEFTMKPSVKASRSRAVVARLNTLAVFFIALGLAVTSTAQTVYGRQA